LLRTSKTGKIPVLKNMTVFVLEGLGDPNLREKLSDFMTSYTIKKVVKTMLTSHYFIKIYKNTIFLAFSLLKPPR